MTKIHYIIILLGSGLFFWDISYGVGWLLGWLFTGLLQQYRGKILDRVIDFSDFSKRRYMAYLLLIVVWIAIPLLISFIIPEYINPFAVFGAFFANRILMFILEGTKKKGVR